MKTIFESYINRIFFIFSENENVNDNFIYDLSVLNFSEVLFRHLKKLGYKHNFLHNS